MHNPYKNKLKQRICQKDGIIQVRVWCTTQIRAYRINESITYQHSPEIYQNPTKWVSNFKLQQTHSKFIQSFIDKEMHKSYNGIFKYLNPR